MNVVVLQSHAKTAPRWIARCTATVRAWARTNGYDYRLLGDELFEGIPLQMALKAESKLPLADFGRLLWIKRLLIDWEGVVWIDSDVVIFDPDSFCLDMNAPFLVCREVLVKRGKGKRRPKVLTGYNPTVLMFRRGADFLDRWLEKIDQTARTAPGFGDAEFGRDLLRQMTPRAGLPAVESVGHFNAAILKEVFGQDGPAVRIMMRYCGRKLAAANLCGHYTLPTYVYLRIINRLLSTHGAVVNDALATSTPARPGAG